MRPAHGASPRVIAANAWFTLLGFMGMYTVLAILWLFLVYQEIERGPEPETPAMSRDVSPAAADLGGSDGHGMVLSGCGNGRNVRAARRIRFRRRRHSLPGSEDGRGAPPGDRFDR